MANKNRNLIIAYFPDADEAQKAAKQLKNWDKETDNIKLGGMGIVTEDKNGKLKTHKVGARAAGTGAKWGTILGVTAGILSGGVTLIGGAIVGLTAGSVTGALFHKRIGMEDHDKERLSAHLKGGGAALAVMADDEEVNPTKTELANLSGDVESYNVPEDAVEELDAATAGANVDEVDEAVLLQEASEESETAEESEEVEESEPVEETEPAAAEKKVTLHFQRHHGDYDGWGLHVWQGCLTETSWEEPIPQAGSDDFGVYFEVPVADGADELAYIIHRGDEKDLGDDQVLNFASDGYEVWIVQNAPGYAAPPTAEMAEAGESEDVAE